MINSRSEETIWPLPCSFLPERRERAGGAQLRAITLSLLTHTRIRTWSHSDTHTRSYSRAHTLLVTLARVDLHMHSRTYTHAHTHTLACSPSRQDVQVAKAAFVSERPRQGPHVPFPAPCPILAGPEVRGAGGVVLKLHARPKLGGQGGQRD